MPFNGGVPRKIEREYLVGDRALQVRLDVEGSVETGEGFVDPAKSGEAKTQHQVSLNGIGIDRQRLLAVVGCVGNLLDLEQDTGPREPPIRVVGCQRNCLIAVCQRFVKSLKFP
ncbi:hypothetical protein ABH975_003136 [Bradyrhizobium ottawaense]